MSNKDRAWDPTIPHELTRKISKWESMDGKFGPIADITDEHLVNILNWVAVRRRYQTDVREVLTNEATHRQIVNFANKKPYPQFNGTKWVLVGKIK